MESNQDGRTLFLSQREIFNWIFCDTFSSLPPVLFSEFLLMFISNIIFHEAVVSFLIAEIFARKSFPKQFKVWVVKINHSASYWKSDKLLTWNMMQRRFSAKLFLSFIMFWQTGVGENSKLLKGRYLMIGLLVQVCIRWRWGAHPHINVLILESFHLDLTY